MKYKFSIVTAVYDTQEYVADAIESIINQSIGFKKNIQLILVNDGSKDNAGDICKEYRDRYPDNIIYIEKENGGVSSARNRGLEEVKGRYVNFLDSDDKLSENALEEVWKFFEKHYDEIDFVSIPIYYFEGKEEEHILNFKFHDTQVIDIKKDPSYIQLSSSSTFFKVSTIKNYKFDETLEYAEDVKLINELLLEKEKYGVLNTVKYLYRKRLSKDSAMQKDKNSKNWYFNALQESFFYLLKLTKEKLGKVPLYYQYVVMYDLQFRLKKKDMSLLDKKGKTRYLSIIKEMLQYIDDDVILDQKHYYQEHKVLALALKYNKSIKEIVKKLKLKKGKLYFKNIKIPISNKVKIDIEEFHSDGSNSHIEGTIKTILPVIKLKLFVLTQQGRFIIKPIRDYKADVLAVEKNILQGYRFQVDIPILNIKDIEFIGKFKNKKIAIKYYFK